MNVALKKSLPILQATRPVATTFVVYRGPSAFNGEPIIAVVTGTDGSSTNKKTGRMAQLWILIEDAPPHEAQKTGADASVCGDCPLRVPLRKGTGEAMCYVVTTQAPRTIWLGASEREVDLAGCLAVLKQSKAMLRLGAYGDPGALPREVVEALAGAAAGITGYTHAWRRKEVAWLRQYAMASVEDGAGRRAAAKAGWRTFRVLPNEGSPLDAQEIMCANRTNDTACVDCGLCDGARPNDRRKSIAIPQHGWSSQARAPRGNVAHGGSRG